MSKINILLVEDDYSECDGYIKDILPRNQNTLHIAHGCNTAFNILESVSIDIILLDLEFNNGDGDGILFLKRLQQKELKIRPYIIIITVNISTKTHSSARKYGADYVFTKSKVDYSPKLIVDFANTIYSSLTENAAPLLYEFQNEDEIKKNIARYMDSIGITYTLDGRGYLIEAIYIASKTDAVNLNKEIYPVIARKYGKSINSIQKGIRVAIERAWRVTDLQVLSDNYTVEVNSITVIPTNKELICYYADMLRHDA